MNCEHEFILFFMAFYYRTRNVGCLKALYLNMCVIASGQVVGIDRYSFGGLYACWWEL